MMPFDVNGNIIDDMVSDYTDYIEEIVDDAIDSNNNDAEVHVSNHGDNVNVSLNGSTLGLIESLAYAVNDFASSPGADLNLDDFCAAVWAYALRLQNDDAEQEEEFSPAEYIGIPETAQASGKADPKAEKQKEKEAADDSDPSLWED